MPDPHDPEMTRDLDPAERELEAALARLRPVTPALDRERLLVEAATLAIQRRAARTVLVWRSAAAILAIGFAMSLAWKPSPQVIERVVIAPATQPAEAEIAMPGPAPIDPGGRLDDGTPTYLALRDEVLRMGIDALPEIGAGRAAPPLTAGARMGLP